jgi:cob(I)alamin adenosyltransferase
MKKLERSTSFYVVPSTTRSASAAADTHTARASVRRRAERV